MLKMKIPDLDLNPDSKNCCVSKDVLPDFVAS